MFHDNRGIISKRVVADEGGLVMIVMSGREGVKKLVLPPSTEDEKAVARDDYNDRGYSADSEIDGGGDGESGVHGFDVRLGRRFD